MRIDNTRFQSWVDIVLITGPMCSHRVQDASGGRDHGFAGAKMIDRFTAQALLEDHRSKITMASALCTLSGVESRRVVKPRSVDATTTAAQAWQSCVAADTGLSRQRPSSDLVLKRTLAVSWTANSFKLLEYGSHA